jgi:hypothetical protein
MVGVPSADTEPLGHRFRPRRRDVADSGDPDILQLIERSHVFAPDRAAPDDSPNKLTHVVLFRLSDVRTLNLLSSRTFNPQLLYRACRLGATPERLPSPILIGPRLDRVNANRQ